MRGKIALSLLLSVVLFAVPVSAVYPNAAEEIVLAEYIAGEADGEPYAVHLAMAAALLNRLTDPRYPDTVSGVLSLLGYRTRRHTESYVFARSAVRAAAEGMDITGGATAWAKADTEKAARLTETFRVEDFVFGREG